MIFFSPSLTINRHKSLLKVNAFSSFSSSLSIFALIKLIKLLQTINQCNILQMQQNKILCYSFIYPSYNKHIKSLFFFHTTKILNNFKPWNKHRRVQWNKQKYYKSIILGEIIIFHYNYSIYHGTTVSFIKGLL